MGTIEFFAVGLGIGIIILVPMGIALRHEIYENFQRLRGATLQNTSDREDLNVAQAKISARSSGEGGSRSIRQVSVFAAAAAALLLVYGLVGGGPFFVASGVVVGLGGLVVLLNSGERS
jgi:hypothetical protein